MVDSEPSAGCSASADIAAWPTAKEKACTPNSMDKDASFTGIPETGGHISDNITENPVPFTTEVLSFSIHYVFNLNNARGMIISRPKIIVPFKNFIFTWSAGIFRQMGN